MIESTQIVRRLQRGEFIPAYSTDELMRGVCHIVRKPLPSPVARYVAPPVVKVPPKPNNGSHADRFAQYRDLIKPLLIANHNNQVIANRLGIHAASIPLYISRDAELRRLSLARTHLAEHMKNTGDLHYDEIKGWINDRVTITQIAEKLGVRERIIRSYVYGVPELRELSYLAFGAKQEFTNGLKEKCAAKYTLHRDAIKQAVMTEPLTHVCRRFGFGYNSLKRHLADEVKNGE